MTEKDEFWNSDVPVDTEALKRVLQKMIVLVPMLEYTVERLPAKHRNFSRASLWTTAIEWGIRLHRDYPEEASNLIVQIEDLAQCVGEDPTLKEMPAELAAVIRGDL